MVRTSRMDQSSEELRSFLVTTLPFLLIFNSNMMTWSFYWLVAGSKSIIKVFFLFDWMFSLIDPSPQKQDDRENYSARMRTSNL